MAISDGNLQSNTNLSSLLSFDILDKDGNKIIVETNENDPFELLIPSDINWIVPEMILQNVSSLNSTELFHYHSIHFTQFKSISVQFQMKSFDHNLGYLLVYKFDDLPRLTTLIKQIDGWSLFCPSKKFEYFLNNKQTFHHQSITFGIRQLNQTEIQFYCTNISSNPPIVDYPSRFSSDYQIRIFTSGCYYLDSKFTWQSDGLTVKRQIII